ncbi:mannitol dehydrogenase family protein [Cellulophaga omnivescoria]|uniref:mannitol dehydrogenase family protein n=1 Tax=Cellulophaga omnivescoria TaxID=1888890 RepID=UPI0022F0EC6E|nr:mannitol dehydrogenase family protein [Cellulophaga omnivescoria]WBU89055.1 mannitol dehydrogenase family protein [Cellulophaga omnivescoria]WKB81029.1 mannitol dehydrogenase family protein [Cellulophaga lytica]
MENIKLNNSNLSKISERVLVPNYDRNDIKTGIVHVGIGGFHRAHQALYTDLLLQNNNNKDWGICGVALLDFDTKIYNTLKEQDGLYTLIVKELDGTHTKQVIGSIVDYLFAPEDPTKVIEKMAHSDVKIITLTITEGGYNYNEVTKDFNFENPLIEHDLNNPQSPKTIYGYLTQALKLRKERGLKGCTIQSCDNIQENGHMIKNMLLSYVKQAQPNLVNWIKKNVSFPNAMVDRITPSTTQDDIDNLKKSSGINDAWPVVCEPFKQWVIEDNFIQGRPAWENVGAQFVTDVVPYEKMKLSLLNAGHSVLGILGALIGYKTIDQAVNNKNISTFLHLYMNVEVTPTLGNLEGLDLDLYKKTLLERFGNPNIKDQIERICSESSSKIPIFILPTVKTNLKSNGSVNLAAFVIAAWAIYSLGKNEKGETLIIKDANKLLLDVKANIASKKPAAFLELDTVFGNLKNSDIFKEAYLKAYNNITNNGVEKCLEEINSNSLSHI